MSFFSDFLFMKKETLKMVLRASRARPGSASHGLAAVCSLHFLSLSGISYWENFLQILFFFSNKYPQQSVN